MSNLVDRMEIRKAKNEDIEDISEIFRIETAKKPYFQKWTKKTALNKIKELLKTEDVHIVLIEKEIIGFIACQKNKNKKSVYLDELWLKTTRQGKGIGTKLMDYIEKKYKKEGIKIISLVSDNRSKAFDFYKKINYGNHKHLVFMGKELR